MVWVSIHNSRSAGLQQRSLQTRNSYGVEIR